MSKAEDLVMDVLLAGLVPFLQSSPGVGKSSLAKEIARKNKLKMIDLRLSQMDPTELQGFPFVERATPEDKEKGKKDRAVYMPMDMFPLEDSNIPEGYTGWLLLLDEFNSASMATQAAAYRLVLDRQVGQHPLHHRTAVMAAGNLTTDKAIVNRLSTAMQSRLVHFTIEVDQKSWITWADNNDIDHRVKSFINFKPEILHKFDPNHNEETFPCPRTWEFTSKLVTPLEKIPHSKLPLLAGTIGEGAGREFFVFSEIYGEIATIEDIKKDPGGIKMSEEPSIQYALTGLVAHHLTPSNADHLMKFLQRMQIDFQVIALKAAIAKDPAIRKCEAIKAWISHNASELM